LRSVLPSASKGKHTRYINIYKGDEFDEAQMANSARSIGKVHTRYPQSAGDDR
jgi:hypothetical protein